MKELIQLFKEAYVEVKRKPLEALFTLFTFITMCATCYLMMIVLWVIGG
tara:strand:- start:289 stop:435 length:147 start_codon:yes stop_codon:yes gene_type:complete